nr:hypothetical protein [Tanacetum cinerariifolium]
MMDADYKLAARLQEEKREKLSIEEKSRLFVKLMDKRKKHFSILRAKKIRSKPPAKAQKRNKMCTYLKNMTTYKHSQLKNKSFKEIQMLFNNTMKWIESFVHMDTELVMGSEKTAEGNEKIAKGSEKITKGGSKRAGDKLEQEDAKRQRIEEENESAELKRCLEIIPDNDDDTMFEHHVEDNIWKYQQGTAKVLNWKLFDSCGVYCVITKNMVYYLLVEKMYLFTRNTQHQMWNDVRLQVDYETKLLIKKLEDSEGKYQVHGRIVGIKRLHDISTAQITTAGRVYADRDEIKDLSEKR